MVINRRILKFLFFSHIVNFLFHFQFQFPLGPVYMEWGTPMWWGRFLLFCVRQSVKTKETNPTRPGSPTPCKQALSDWTSVHISYGIVLKPFLNHYLYFTLVSFYLCFEFCDFIFSRTTGRQ